MNDSIARAKFIDKLMTAVFYCVAGFFILLLVAFALYVIINGFKDFSWSLISFEGSGIGNLFFNTIYLVFLSLLVSVPLVSTLSAILFRMVLIWATRSRLASLIWLQVPLVVLM